MVPGPDEALRRHRSHGPQRRQVLRQHPRPEGRQLRHPPRQGHDAVRRERRRQVDADEGAVGRHQAELGHDRAQRPARGFRVLVGRARPRHLDHPPGAQPRAEPQRPRQHLHGPRDPGARRHRLRRGGAPGRGPDGGTGGGDRPADPRRGPAPRPAADHRDRPRAVGRFAHPHHGRADLGAQRLRGRGAVQGDPRPQGPRRRHRLHLPPPRGGAGDHRSRRGAAGRRHDGQGRSEGRRSRMDRPQHGGRGLRPRLAADRLSLRRGRPVGPGRQRRRQGGPRRHGGGRGCRSTSAPARSSASTG